MSSCPCLGCSLAVPDPVAATWPAGGSAAHACCCLLPKAGPRVGRDITRPCTDLSMPAPRLPAPQLARCGQVPGRLLGGSGGERGGDTPCPAPACPGWHPHLFTCCPFPIRGLQVAIPTILYHAQVGAAAGPTHPMLFPLFPCPACSLPPAIAPQLSSRSPPSCLPLRCAENHGGGAVDGAGGDGHPGGHRAGLAVLLGKRGLLALLLLMALVPTGCCPAPPPSCSCAPAPLLALGCLYARTRLALVFFPAVHNHYKPSVMQCQQQLPWGRHALMQPGA